MVSSLTNFPTQYDALFFLVSLVGMIAHWAKKRAKKEISCSLKEWFFTDNVPACLLTLGAFAGANIAVLSSGISADMNFYAFVQLAFTTGYAIDSGFNSPSKE